MLEFTKLELVIQELMQTDLHRVIRTQSLSDDHCQVTIPFFQSMSSPTWFFLVLHLPAPSSPQVHPQRRHRPQRPQTCKPTVKCEL